MGETERFVALLSDDAFRALYRRIDHDAFGRASFDKLPMPEGFSPDEIWDVIEAMRRLNAHVFPYKSYAIDNRGVETWCSLNGRIGPMLREVVTTARSRQEKEAFNRYSYLDVLAEDLSAAAARDGLHVGVPAVRKLVGHQMAPSTNDEAYVANVAGILLEIEKYARYPLSPWMLDEFAIRMGEVPRATAIDGRGSPAFPNADPVRSSMVPLIMETVNDGALSLEEYVLNLLATSLVIWDLSPFPRFNSMFELIVRNWALESRSLSHLRNVPFLALCRAWELGGGEQLGVSEGYYDVIADRGDSHDATPFFGNALIIVTRELKLLDEHRGGMRKEEADLETRAREAYPDINDRQLDVLRSHSRNPSQTTTVALHMSLCKVSYGTARSDLLGLSGHGLLSQEWQGRAMVFRSA